MKIIEDRLKYLKDRIICKQNEYTLLAREDIYTRARIGREIDELKDLRKLSEAILHQNVHLAPTKTLQ